MQQRERRSSAEAVAANGGYRNALKKTEAGRGVLKAVQPGEDTQVYRTSTNGQRRLQNANVRDMMREHLKLY